MDLVQQNKKAYNAIAKHFSATRAVLWPEFNEFTPFLAKSQRVLDWGCGNGRLIYLLEGRGIEYFGVDQSTGNLTEAKKIHAQATKAGWAHFYSTATREKKFPKEFFDNVFMIASFFHLPDEKSRLALLEKTYYELKPGGHLIILVWNLESAWAKERKNKWKEIAKNDYLIPWKSKDGKVIAERYYHHFSESELKDLLLQTKFQIEKIKYSENSWTDDKAGRNMLAIAAKP